MTTNKINKILYKRKIEFITTQTSIDGIPITFKIK